MEATAVENLLSISQAEDELNNQLPYQELQKISSWAHTSLTKNHFYIRQHRHKPGHRKVSLLNSKYKPSHPLMNKTLKSSHLQ